MSGPDTIEIYEATTYTNAVHGPPRYEDENDEDLETELLGQIFQVSEQRRELERATRNAMALLRSEINHIVEENKNMTNAILEINCQVEAGRNKARAVRTPPPVNNLG
ncbi:hypothetical protein BGX34_011788 [Mortierella sp. NVP85]|nr:hypothetical protein BGX34_011788 [Mortierella sp. NVP85]